ncbi:MAG: family 43 glycosylhydrolase [Pseudobutyrivibrio sp.]|nr:family 43 glycosylhydrolase [Pseudobutyrivibrio sp.]
MTKPETPMEVLDSICDDGTPFLFTVAEKGDFDTIEYVLAVGKLSLNATDARGKNMLHYAARSSNMALVSFLVERCGMSLSQADHFGVTPLEEAVKLNNQPVMEYFAKICGAPYEELYNNPIRRGFFPDPSIIRVGDDYYMVNSSFVFFPCIPISHSRDLIHWEIVGHAITNPDWARLSELQGGRGYWAPDISYDGNKFYITATLRLNDGGEIIRLQMVTTSDRPEGPYGEPSFIDFDGIDPSIFHEDGKHYMLLNRGARIAQLNDDCTDIISKPALLWYGDQKRGPEGPHLLKKDGFYYLLLAEGGTGEGHRITVARSRELMGIYEPCPYNPIMRQWDEVAYITRCGHGKLVQTALGDWYMVYLCGRTLEGKFSLLGRETALDPVIWTADGWPIVNSLDGPSYLQKKPEIASNVDVTLPENNYPWREFMTAREPEENAFVIDGSKIKLLSSSKALSTMESRNILLRRQSEFIFSATVTVVVPGQNQASEAGLTCYYDENSHLCYYIRSEGNAYYLGLKERIGLKDVLQNEIALESIHAGDRIELKTDGNYLSRSFSFRKSNEQPWNLTHNLEEVTYLCDEGLNIGKRFTGALVGIYALSENSARDYVTFENFSYENN